MTGWRRGRDYSRCALALRAVAATRQRSSAHSAPCRTRPIEYRGFEPVNRIQIEKGPTQGPFCIWRRGRDYSRFALALRAVAATRQRSSARSAPCRTSQLNIEGSNPSLGAKNTKRPHAGAFLYLAEREGLLTLRARPSGRCRCAATFFGAFRALSNQPIEYRGFESVTRIIHRKRGYEAPFSMNGGEGGIRTLDGLLTHTPLAGERLRPLGHLS